MSRSDRRRAVLTRYLVKIIMNRPPASIFIVMMFAVLIWSGQVAAEGVGCSATTHWVNALAAPDLQARFCHETIVVMN